MNRKRALALIAIVTGLLTVTLPRAASASGVYNCTNGNCSNSGGNGDNGSGNGNSSGTSTVNVNGTAASGAASSSAPSSGSGRANNVSVPVQLPSFAASGCGSRPTLYGALTGSPGFGRSFGSAAGLAFGVGFITAVGKEPEYCKLAAAAYASYVPLQEPAIGAQGVPQTAPAPQTRAALATPSRAPLAAQTGAAPVYAPAIMGTPARLCAHIDADVADFYIEDLRQSTRQGNAKRIDRDLQALTNACLQAKIAESISGT